MKNILIIILIVGISFGHKTSFSQKITFKGKEYIIDLDSADLYKYDFFIDTTQVKDKITKFKQSIRKRWCSGHPILSHHAIPMSEIVRLYRKADSVAKSKVPEGEKYITGLEMHYYIKRNKMEIYYQSWYLSSAYINGDSVEGVKESLPEVYFLKNNMLAPLTGRNQLGKAKKDFVKAMRKRRNGRFVAYDTADTKSAIFSFQELLFLYHLNYPGDYFYNKRIVSIEGAVVKGNVPRITAMFNCEECVISDIKEDILPDPIQQGYGANLAHLCPPNCNDLVYPIK